MHYHHMRPAYQQLCHQFKPNTFITLATNQTWTPARMKMLVGSFFAHMDRWYLGHTWLNKSLHIRTDGIGFIEHVNTNIHIHLLVNFYTGNMWGRRMMSQFYWNKLCKGGSVEIGPINDIDNLAHYCTKEMAHRSYNSDDQIILLRDYFPA